MKERPILFSAAMVRALLSGAKTQTRRVVRPGVLDEGWPNVAPLAIAHAMDRCPFPSGMKLWVKETWRLPAQLDALSPGAAGKKAVAAGYERPWAPVQYEADGARRDWDSMWGEPGKTRVSIHMPRWASRITLEVTSVRIERLCDISEEDAKAEGVEPFRHDPEGDCWTARPSNQMHRSAFECLWGEINGWDGEPKARAPWTSNPWVWVVGFRRVGS